MSTTNQDHLPGISGDDLPGETLSTGVDGSTGVRRLDFRPMTSPANIDSPRFGARDIQTYDVLDLFAGPGGLDVAAHFLDLSTIGIEWDANACETRYAAGLPTIHADVRAAREDAELCEKLVTRTRMLTGGPPCQTFSVAGRGAGRKALTTVTRLLHSLLQKPESVDHELESLGDDPRTALVLEPLRWILEAIKHDSPFEAIALEQVPAVLPVWHVYEEILRNLLPDGWHYRTYADVLCTEQYGVPQTRRRAVLIAQLLPRGQRPGDRKEDEELLPGVTHRRFLRPKDETLGADGADALFPQSEASVSTPLGAEREVAPDEPPLGWKSMEKALHEARDALPGSSALIPRHTPFVVVSNYGSGGDPANRGRRPSSMPAFTVTGKVSRNRLETEAGQELPRFTIQEAGVLQTFPADFPWSGRDRAQQVGNAVPPRFAAHVLASAASALPDFDKDRLRTALKSLDAWHWEEASTDVQGAMRALGCADRAACPTSPTHVSK